MTLRELLPGESGDVGSIKGISASKRRILEMGITPGTKVTVIKVAPLGDPIEIELRGYNLSIRKEDAEAIEIVSEL